jgi:hypothetical protein
VRRLFVTFALLLALPVLLAGGALYYMLGVPGRSYDGPLPPMSADETALVPLLLRHIERVAELPHNIAHYDELETSAGYIEAALAGYGYAVNRQEFVVDGRTVRNIEVVIEPRDDVPSPQTVVVGAHYDSAGDAPGANDNATGTAAVIELARLLGDLRGKATRRIRLVLFVNEEQPYAMTSDMGSARYADALGRRKEDVAAMYSLETLGFYSDAPGSQRYPKPFSLFFPNRGDFVAFVGMLDARPLLRQAIGSFRAHAKFPSIGGVAPERIPGIAWSDHWAFAQRGIPAIMITDTAPFRYPYYHRPTDTADKVDMHRLARVVKGIEAVIRDAAR